MKKLQIILILLALTICSREVQAATAEVMVNTASETINAVEGEVVLPRGVNIEQIQTGNSAVLVWIQEPKFNKEHNSIIFSGISPGGFQGEKPIFSFTGDFTPEDIAHFSYTNVVALRNDGSGTPVTVSLSTRALKLSKDDAPPEPFQPVLSSSPDIYNGHKFISFLAQDKGLGVERYEYASSWIFTPRKNGWQQITSPYLLTKSDLFKRIYVRAIDRSGNYRVSEVDGPYHSYFTFGGIIFIVCSIFLLRRLRKLRS
jgi:hypothetical protein